VSYLLAIDPGMHKTGYALFNQDDGNLKKSGLLEISDKVKGMDAVVDMANLCFTISISITELAIEIQKHRGSNERANPNNLMMLQGLSAAVIAMYDWEGLEYGWAGYLPVQWKGTMPKEIMCKRIAKKFGLPEDTDDNILDAIGIGDYHNGRSKTK